MTYKKEEAIYNIQVVRGEEKGMKIDGEIAKDNTCPFSQNGVYDVQVTI